MLNCFLLDKPIQDIPIGFVPVLTFVHKSYANVLYRSHAKFRQKDFRKRRIRNYQYLA